MSSQMFSRTHPISFDVSPSPETMYHFPISPGEPGKFDFYRVHLANNAYHSNPMFSDNSDAPTLSVPTTSLSSITKRRWTPFADIVPCDLSKSSILTSSASSNSLPTSNSQTAESSVSSNTKNIQNEPIQSVSSFSSLTDVVKNAMNKGHLNVPVKQIRRPSSGTTLSTKDLNHLSPQSS